MPESADGHRDRGLELGDLPEKLDEEAFPIGKEALLDAHGEHELAFEDGEPAELAAILRPAGVDEFETRERVFETIYTMVGSRAVGRRGETGRGTSDLTPPEAHRPPDRPDDQERSL